MAMLKNIVLSWAIIWFHMYTFSKNKYISVNKLYNNYMFIIFFFFFYCNYVSSSNWILTCAFLWCSLVFVKYLALVAFPTLWLTNGGPLANGAFVKNTTSNRW